MRKKFKKSDVLRFYDHWAQDFDQDSQQLFSKDGERLVTLSNLDQGVKVLDVATGRGAVLFPAARAVGKHGFALGVDLSGQMVRYTSREVGELEIHHAALSQMDAEYLAIAENSFDYVLCGYGLFFLPELTRGLREFLRVLKPGGRFITSTDGGSDPRWSWYWDLLKSFQALPSPASQSLEREGELQELLEQVGFIDVNELEEPDDVVYNSPEAWWETREALMKVRLPNESVEPFRQAAFHKLESMREEDGIHRTSYVRFTKAVKPALQRVG